MRRVTADRFLQENRDLPRKKTIEIATNGDINGAVTNSPAVGNRPADRAEPAADRPGGPLSR